MFQVPWAMVAAMSPLLTRSSVPLSVSKLMIRGPLPALDPAPAARTASATPMPPFASVAKMPETLGCARKISSAAWREAS